MVRTSRISVNNGYQTSIWGLYYYALDSRSLVSLPLLNVCVAASIKELAAQVKLTHTYGNDADFAIEAFYSFPIPARAVVCSFVMIKQDGTRVVGRVEEKVEARETYEVAVSEGKQAALMEQETSDVFQLAVGNIQPKEQVQIELIYATVLSEDEENDSIRFHIPMHIGDRYGQSPSSDIPGIQWNYYFTAPNTPFLEISANIEAVAPIAKISCPSHTVSTELGPDPELPNAKDLPFSNYARVSFSSESTLDRDFVLTVKSAGLDAPRCIAELHPIHPTVALALTLVPRFKLPDVARQEFIFLVDRSGSMSGLRIKAAKAALVVMLRSLPAQDSLFQIASFGSNCTKLWEDGSRPYNQDTLEYATTHIDKMSGNYGGTEIRNALQSCFETRKTDRPTSVFVLTDGEAWDLEGVFTEVKGAVASAPEQAYLRVFVLGIGNSASTAMCQGIARVGNGTCMMVGEKETSFTGKIARMLKAARAPLISDISVDWGVPIIEAPTGVDEADAPMAVDGEDAFVMVSDDEGNETAGGKAKEKGKEKEKVSINIFDETVDPIQIDKEPPPPAPEVVLAPPPQVQQSPFRIRTLSPGNRLNLYAILQGKTVPETVTLTGLTADGSEILLSVPVTLSTLPNAPESPPAVHALAARTIIQDLEDGQHSLAIDDPDLLARTIKASIVRLAKEFSISSSETSFIAVDDSPASTSGTQRVQQPNVIYMPNMIIVQPSTRSVPGFRGRGGRGGVGRGSFSGGNGGLKRKSMAEPVTAPAPAMKARTRRTKRRRADVVDVADFAVADEEAGAPTADPQALENLARLQLFNGCFSLAVLSVVRLITDAAQARRALLDGISDEVFATVLAMAFMRHKLGPEVERDSWEAMYDKARAFVERTIQVSVDELEAKAASMLAA
ncbi:von Willebrand factor type A domain-containing protein [Mycena capillaripes]|nr:von Willebrand factor type A domain-containing protein [Mycena capillaripes]